MFIISIVMVILSLLCGVFMLWSIPGFTRLITRDLLPDKKASLIIPAYNEEKRLPALLASLQMQDFRAFEILVVDDHSSDQTAEIAASYGVQVITSLDLRKGWVGKSRACWSGALAAKGDYFVFLDADVWFENSSALRRLLTTYEQTGASGILSVQPYHDIKRPYENLSVIFNIIVMAGMNVFTPLKERITSAGAFGPCLICDRKAYFESGGHEAIKGAVMDDLALGRAVEKLGLPVHCFGGRHLLGFRMYPDGLPGLLEGWTKNFGTASQSTHPAVFAMIIIWITGGFASTAFLIRQMLQKDLILLFLAALLYLIYLGLMYWQARRVGRFSLWSFILYVVHFIFFTVVFIWSLIKTKLLHAVSWRGRSIDV